MGKQCCAAKSQNKNKFQEQKSDLELRVRWTPFRNLTIGLNYLSLVFLDLSVSTLRDCFKASTNKDHYSSLNS